MDDALRVIRPSDRTPDVASGAMRREAAVSDGLVGAGWTPPLPQARQT